MKTNPPADHGLPGAAYISTCARCNKRSFYNRKQAKSAAKAISPNGGTRAYPCPVGDGWHWGHRGNHP